MAQSRKKKLKIERRLNIETRPVPQKIFIEDLDLDMLIRSKKTAAWSDEEVDTKSRKTDKASSVRSISVIRRSALAESKRNIAVVEEDSFTIENKLDDHVRKLNSENEPLLLLHEHSWQGKYLEHLYLMHFHENKEYTQFKHDLPKNELRRRRMHQDWAYYLNNSKYVDLVWRNKNEARAFIVLQHGSAIDAVQGHSSLFDIKTVAS